ncbi:P-loop containing nucleoside triphosphate hydrolase protein [Crepidotus variabilis]|uniref:P-loop containing nucleoside triphosphate hydrolase protein n=1 Tax=Crepidotus variabilis TaxID=179855 RepID=A0A9P6EBH9_9AGAR|nr:P-loop containing nucleoside triphosphate hydrolase protein [Crepidotus variabilis]
MAHIYQRSLPNLSRNAAIALEKIVAAKSERRAAIARRQFSNAPGLDLRSFCSGRSHCAHVVGSRRSFSSRPIAQQFSSTHPGPEEEEWAEAAFKQHPGDYLDGFSHEHIPRHSNHLHSDYSSRRYDWRQKSVSRMSQKERQREKDAKSGFIRKRPDPPDMDVGDPYHVAVRDYKEKFYALLEHEEEEDAAALRNRLSTWSVQRLEREGYCLTGVSAYWLAATRYGRPVASFTLGPGEVIPDNKLENGSQILLSRVDPLAENPEKGSILARTESHLHICFPEKFSLQGQWRLDLGRPNLTYERMRTAVSSFAYNPKQIELVSDDKIEYALAGTTLRDVLLKRWMPSHSHVDAPVEVEECALLPTASGAAPQVNLAVMRNQEDLVFDDMGAFKDDQRIVSWVKRYMRRDPIVIDGDPKLPLNESQVRAMAAMIGRKISLIQGPPGTGKTKTIIETVKLLKAHFQVSQPLLVCTYTNVAVDNLVEGFARFGVKPLRVGFAGNIRESLRPHSLEFKRQEHPMYPDLVQLEKDLEKLTKEKFELKTVWMKLLGDLKNKKEETLAVEGGKKRRRSSKELKAENMLKALDGMKARESGMERKMYAMQQQILKDVIGDADVICTTCITAACAALNVVDFPVVFLDEASMSTEPASLIPIMKGSQHVALIGDHKQLPPVIISKEAKEGGLNVSLFERLTEEGHVHSSMLNTQYRMHPEISHFPALEFYDLALMDGTVDAGGNALAGLEPPESKHLSLPRRTQKSDKKTRPSVIFLDHGGNESMKGRSRVNVTEAHLVASVVEDLLLANPTLKGDDIGIIAPYAAQIQLLTRYFNHDPHYKDRFESVLGSQRAMQLPKVEIKTVDGFEGREKEVIIFSTVRNNEDGNIGFLADKKRLNVGLTRAKRGLFVLGSIRTLKSGRPMGEATPGYRISSADDDELETGSPLATEVKAVRKRKSPKSTAPSRAASETTPKLTKNSRGNESWQRYAQFMLDRNLVISLSGSKLDHALYGHLDALRKSPTDRRTESEATWIEDNAQRRTKLAN